MGTLDPSPSSSTSNSKKCMNNPMKFSINKDIIKKAENQDVNSIQRIVAYDHLEFETSMFIFLFYFSMKVLLSKLKILLREITVFRSV